MNQVTFGEVSMLIEILQSVHDSVAAFVSSDEEGRSKMREVSRLVNGLKPEEVKNKSEQEILDEMSSYYDKIYVLIDKLKNAREGDVGNFLHILFPYHNLHSSEIETPSKEKVDEKIKFIKEFLIDPSHKYTSTCEYEGNVFLFGQKDKKNNVIKVYECTKWVKHLFRTDTPDNPNIINV